MPEEYLDIVDENNNPTGESKPRSLVHSTGLWHRTVHIYLFRKNDNIIEFLVHLRAKTKDLSPNKWDTRFGGHIKIGEDVEQAVVDEIKEELGLNINTNDLIEGDWIKRKRDYPNNEFSKVYYLEFKGDIKDLRFDDGEVQTVRWLSIKEIENSMKKESDKWSGENDLNKITKFLLNKLLNRF